MTQYKKSPAILGNVVDITSAKLMEEKLIRSRENLRMLSSKLLAAQEEERRRVALELHDGIGQSLSAMKYRAEAVVKKMEAEKDARWIDSFASLVPLLQGAIEEVRAIQMALRPSLLDDLGIISTLSWFFREFESSYPSIQVEKQVDIVEENIPDRLRTVIYRISQEALNNIAKHSCANLVRFFLKRSDDSLQLSIQDNGVGFDVDEKLSAEGDRRGLGLSGMRERARFSGGTFRIESCKNGGTTVQTSWPVDEEPP